MYTPMTLGELMEAQEGEGIQFKEQRTVLILEKHFVAAVRFQTVAGENLSLVFQINALDKLWAAKHLNSPNAHVRV